MERDELCGRSLGEFILRERIGEGGFGAVYRAEQPLLGREAVIKVLHRRLRGSETALQRFMREARLASRLDHPYAAHVYAFGVEKQDGLFWIAMEMVHGTPLDQWLRKRGKLPLDQLVPFFERIAEVVHTAHEKGIVHRDLKPQNVMVIERAGRLLPKLLDLGIAKLMEGEPSTTPASLGSQDTIEVAPAEPPSDPLARTAQLAAPPPPGGNRRRPSEVATLPPEEDAASQAAPLIARLTQAGAAVGSPPYMAPEQWMDAWTAGPPADLYSLGVLAYEALSGRRPFDAPTVHAYLALHLHAPVPPLANDGTPALDRFFARALAKQPRDRPATALELAAALRVASGLAEETVAMPKLDEGVRDAWLADGPQPIAEAIAALDGARNPHQARDTAWDLVRGIVRYLLALALAARAQVRGESDEPRLVELLRALRRRDLQEDERVLLLRLLVRPFATRRAAHPLPELVDFAEQSSDENFRDPLDRILQLKTSSDALGLSDDQVRGHLAQVLPAIAQLLRATGFLLDHPLVVPRSGVVERWTGLRRARRPLATIKDRAPVEREPMVIDGEGNVRLLLAPLVQIVAPTLGAEDELFVFDGRGRHGARLIAAPAGFEHHDALLWDWLGEHVLGKDDDRLTSLDDAHAPYLGLASFSTADADRFVGREREIDAFVNRLRMQPLGVVVGASGAGKSSFVHAGVVPALPQGWRSITMRPGASPVAVLAAKLSTVGVSSVSLDTSPAVAIASIERTAASTVVVIVDQLEELVTLCADEAERLKFAAMLAQLAASADAPLRVVCTIRDDFLMRVEALPPLRTRLSAALMLLGNPSNDDLVRTVVEPARRIGYELSEPELAQQMVEEVADRPGALALLSFTAARLWELRDRRFRQLTRKAYDAMGGVGGALGKHADDTFMALAGEDQKLARELFRHLVTGEGTRAVLSPAELREILGSPRADAVIEKLVAARLVVVADTEGEPRVEIIHEALIGAWPRLQQWVHEDAEGSRMRDQLRSAARQWDEHGRPKGLLWRDDVLADLERWRRRPETAALTHVEVRFADASRAETMRARRIRRALVVVAFVLLASAAVVSLRLMTEAREQRALATTSAAKAADMAADTMRRLAEQSEEQGRVALLEGNASVALLHFVAALDQGAEQDTALDFMIREAMKAFDAQRIVMRGHDKAVTSFDALDDDHVVSSSEDGTLRVWNLATGQQQRRIDATVALGSARVDATGKRVVASGKDGVARLFSIDGRLLLEMPGKAGKEPPSFFYPAFSPDGSRIATVHGLERALRIWDVRTGGASLLVTGGAARDYYGKAVAWSPSGEALAFAGQGAELRDMRTGGLRAALVHDGPITNVAFSADGTLLATASSDRTAAIWDARSGALRSRLEGHAGSVELVVFDPSGKYLVTGSRDLTARVWETGTGRLRSVLDGFPGVVRAATFHAGGNVLVTTTEAGTIALWEAPDGRFLGRLEGHSEAITHVRYVRDDLVTSSADGTIRVWRPEQSVGRALTPCKSPTTFALDTSGDRIVIGCADGSATIASPKTGGTVALAGHAEAILVAGFIADARIVTHAEDQSIRVWKPDGSQDADHPLSSIKANSLAISRDLASIHVGQDRRVITLDAITGSVRSEWTAAHRVEVVDVSRDGTRLSALFDGGLDFHDARTGARLGGIGQRPLASSFSSKNELAVSTGEEVERWDANGHRLQTLVASSRALAIRYNASGDRIATGASNGSVEVWDASGARLAQLEGHFGRVIDVGFDARGLVISVGIDGTLRIWDPGTARLLASYKSHHGTPYVLRLADGGRRILSSDLSGAVMMFAFDHGPVDLARVRRVTACLPFELHAARVIRSKPKCQ